MTESTDTTTRLLGTVERDGREARVATVSKTYPTTSEDLWHAVTTPERLARWLAPVSGDLIIGGRFQVENNAGGTVLTCDAPREFTATWEYGEEVSWLTVRISDDGEDTARLELEHTAFVADEWWSQFGPGATGVGWDLGLYGLELHLANPDVERPEDQNAWVASDEGKDFVTASSEAWARVSVAAGTPADEATAAALRTTAFYTELPTEG
ncbi:polyketide cyclase [Occultella glacieicola]|uniref:Polyketide cyclase n=1 Tax=Occultella glacieicola TaxID=2518684 RepID=A0ABY2E8D9_9MICO|nr:SRPBCC domain-containing protein [Occultella glacieicola]TDE97391.1 polyketide cyclase [Occultella glacieicola]